MSEYLDTSFDKDDIVVEGRISDQYPDDGQPIPVKKLQETFDSMAKPEENSFRVYLRVRPVSESIEQTTKIISDNKIVTTAPANSSRAKYTKLEERQYAFTRVFGPSSHQSEVYNHSVDPLVERFLKGESCILFAYGMTNAGKTYTIQGTQQDPGVISLFSEKILDHISKCGNCTLQLAMVEIYNDNVYDLSIKPKPRLKVRDANGKVEICQLVSNPISVIQDSTKLVEKAASNRCQASTLLNSGSSRSHAIYLFTLTKRVNGVESSSVFHIVDLAGAERMVRTEANKFQQNEANNINKSLMQLWLCLDKMKKRNNESTGVVPFRENKLTHLLMPVLSRVGLAGVTMIACINPQPSDYDETISILDNASLAQEIKEIDIGRNVPEKPPISNGNGKLFGNKLIRGAAVASIVASFTAANANANRKRKIEQDSSKIRKTASSEEGREKTSLTGNDSDCENRSDGGGSRNSGTSIITTASDHQQQQQHPLEQECKRLRLEVEQLREENEILQMRMVTIESTVRLEVSKEMEQSTTMLLGRIRELQDANRESNGSTRDLTKSCKKERRKLIAQAQEELTQSLEEANEECERLKAEFDIKEMDLLAKNAALSMELAETKSKYEAAQRSLAMAPKMTSASSTSPNRPSGSVLVMPAGCSASNGSFSSASAAESFNLRMGRDPRFQKQNALMESKPASPFAAQKNVLTAVFEDSENIDENSCPVEEPSGKLQAQSRDIENVHVSTAFAHMRQLRQRIL